MELNKKLIKILIVDDDIVFVNQMLSMLQSLGYDASAAFSPLEAQYLIRRQPFHIVFLDCLMPEMNGYALAQDIRKNFGSSVSIILMSGVFGQGDVSFMENVNIFSMIRKPVKQNYLGTEIRQAVDKLLYSSSSKSFSSTVCGFDVSFDSIQEKLQGLLHISEGDILTLFFYLLRRKSNAVLSLSDEKYSVKIKFSNGGAYDFSEKNSERAIHYFSKNSILEESEMRTFLDAHTMSDLHQLVSNGYISPHYYNQYKKNGIEWAIRYFSKQKLVKASLEKIGSSNSEGMRNVHDSLHISHFIESLTSFMEKELSESFVNSVIDESKEHKVYVDDSQKRVWLNSELSILKPVRAKQDELNSGILLDQFLSSNSSFSVNRSLFWLLSQGVIFLKRDNLAPISLLYEQRYKCFYKMIKDMDRFKMFEFLGCSDVSDKNQVKKVYLNYMRFNHLDRLSSFSLNTQNLAGQCSQLIGDAYQTLVSDENLKKYKKIREIKKTKREVDFLDLKMKLTELICFKKYNTALDLIQKTEEKKDLEGAAKTEMMLWKWIVEIEKNNYKINNSRIRNISQSVSRISDLSQVSMDIYYYALCLVEAAHSNVSQAGIFCQKALKENPKFQPARSTQIILKKMAKTPFSKIEKFLTSQKKAS